MEKLTSDEYKDRRITTGLTQSEMAEELGISRETVSRRENGREVITLEASLALAQIGEFYDNDFKEEMEFRATQKRGMEIFGISM